MMMSMMIGSSIDRYWDRSVVHPRNCRTRGLDRIFGILVLTVWEFLARIQCTYATQYTSSKNSETHDSNSHNLHDRVITRALLYQADEAEVGVFILYRR
jgi:hypothetical protein